jgi:hypothetical protein
LLTWVFAIVTVVSGKKHFVSGTVKGVKTARVNIREKVSGDVGCRRRKDTGDSQSDWHTTGEDHGQNEPPLVENKEPEANEIAITKLQSIAEEEEVDWQESESTASSPGTPEIETSPSIGILIDIRGYRWQLENVQIPIGGPLRRRQWVSKVPGVVTRF